MVYNLYSFGVLMEKLSKLSAIRGRIFLFASVLRLHHWLKNTLIFVPAFLYSSDSSNLYRQILGFLSFSLIASSGYIINDFNDRHTDRSNPVKAMRPIARSSIANRAIFPLGVFTFVMALASGVIVSSRFLVIIISYFLLSLCYTFYLKRFAPLRVISIQSFYILRLCAGFIIAKVTFSVPCLVLISLLVVPLSWLKIQIDSLNYNIGYINHQLKVKISKVQILLFLNYCVAVFVVTKEVHSELVRDQLLKRPDLIFFDASLAIIFFMLIHYFGVYRRILKEPIILCLRNPLILFTMILGLSSVWLTRN